ncbi:gamma carbonic anhydrase family protein [Stakelama saccharophila]|uniref:Gamma carbonic anhydrase family protein n=1 Tax=Stakelama saccharophila TaxID=3075605 RepID=A0ABZ0B5A4_9SPHN|nr:gamma carbonic anhydrase family protein [Stakelama sp. W311]WNO52567.1 gamma carbonic anhydrase family protein [Stakelama sp. W311]
MPLYEIDGKCPQVAPGAWIAPSADVVGDVVIAEGASIWFGAVVRGDNTRIDIGERSNIQEGAMLHSDPGAPLSIGADCTVGHHAVLHGCVLKDCVLVGMGAIVLNNAVLPADCMVGAGALVTEGKTFDPGSLILGSPARSVRALDEQAIAMLKLSASHYADRSRNYAHGLTRIDEPGA